MSKKTSAFELKIPMSTIRERFTGMLADWGADFSTLLEELEEKRALLQEIEAEAAKKSHEIEAVHKRVKVQDTLIETLKAEAEEAGTLRKEIRVKDRELEKKKSEIDSKHVLIDSLRRDIKEVGQLKGAIKTKDKENARLVKEKQHAQQHAAKLTEELKSLTEEFKILDASASMAIDAATELEAVRAELDMRKTLIESLRVDAERAQALEAQLKKKRDVISKLEASIDQHVSTLAESQQSVTTWKEKYASLKSRDPSSESTIAPELTEEELQTQESAEDISEDPSAATAPHDMRKSLLEA